MMTKCDVCDRQAATRWERGGKSYCCVGCAVWDGYNPLDGVPVHPHETREADRARPLYPPKQRGRAVTTERPDWRNPRDGILTPWTKA